jgi:hypothetical protein
MDVRLTVEQQQLRDAAAKLADDLGPRSVQALEDNGRTTQLDKHIELSGWRSLRSDGASGVDVAIVVEEFGRGLVDAPLLGPVLADDLARHIGIDSRGLTIAIGDRAFDARGQQRALTLDGTTVLAADLGAVCPAVDLTRANADTVRPAVVAGEVDCDVAGRWLALALVTTSADLVGSARGAHALACDYAKIRAQYGKSIGSYQAVAHLLAEGLALIEGSVSVLRHGSWAVDTLTPVEAIRAARVAKLYCAWAARTVCETAIQVHGGIGNTWDCLAHIYLRRALTSTELWPVKLEEVDVGLS